MKEKHTPQPWTILQEGTEDDCIVRTIMAPGKGPRNLSEVALVTTGSYPDEVEAANARLIACAPEMLDMLKRIYDSPILSLKTRPDEVTILTKELPALISRASGEEQTKL